MCTVDWAALGTWVIGFATVAVAILAYQYTRGIDRAQDKAAARRARAYALATVEEFKSLRQRADACLQQIDKVRSGAPDAPPPGAVAAIFAAMPSFAPSDWLSESPAIGDLHDEAIPALARAIAAASEVERMRGVIARVLGDVGFDHFGAASAPLFQSSATVLGTLILRADDAVPLLERTAAPR